MAVDAAIDHIQLEACLNAEADVIRSHAGNDAAMIFDYENSKGFSDDLSALFDKSNFSLQSKSVEITENGTYTILPDTGYSGFKELYALVNIENSGISGTEIIITSDASNMESVAYSFFPDYPNGFYERNIYIVLWEADFMDNPAENHIGYFIFMTDENGVARGQYISRFRGGVWTGTTTISTSYDGVVSVGDKFIICKYKYEG